MNGLLRQNTHDEKPNTLERRPEMDQSTNARISAELRANNNIQMHGMIRQKHAHGVVKQAGSQRERIHKPTETLGPCPDKWFLYQSPYRETHVPLQDAPAPGKAPRGRPPAARPASTLPQNDALSWINQHMHGSVPNSGRIATIKCTE